MNPSAAKRRVVVCATWVGVLLTLTHLCWLQFRPRSELRQLHALAEAGTAPPALARYRLCDELAAKAGNTNLFLQLTGSAPTNTVDDRLLGLFYFRVSYALYPRRLYVAPADIILNHGSDLLRVEFNPDESWLKNHQVGWRLTLDRDRFAWQLRPIEGTPLP